LGVSTDPAHGTKLILIAGPYRSGTGDDPELLARNVRLMETFALPVFRAGHVPVIGEWLALPLVHAAGSQSVGDEAFNEIFHPIAIRLLEKCDAVLRVGGASTGADEMVRVARERGLAIYSALAEIPGYSALDSGKER
jgi:GDP-mannose pyrophosphatase NudK